MITRLQDRYNDIKYEISFLWIALSDYFRVWAIAPFSPSTQDAVIENIRERSSPKTILELWWGFWWVTRKLAKWFPSATIKTFETNKYFVHSLKEVESNFKNVAVFHESAEYIWKYVDEVDVIVSTLPFTNFWDTLMRNILEANECVLKSGGIFVLVQYSNYQRRSFRKYLKTCSLINEQRIMRNMPPAKVFVFQKK